MGAPLDHFMAASLWTALDPLGHLLQFLLWALDFAVWLVPIPSSEFPTLLASLGLKMCLNPKTLP